ncbi:hypothetical protein AMC99_01907 [Altererythrobacter epoxidivorans]|uniref:Uncharacterized protein n=1 Tax=Altererythrobacter epoxidivorans TaxID=361183 RepID=A0A0M4MUK1_9SPHN|nr:hypothetical protein [Altererythrobacter epoxidivorans]ALE17195.1 hypothetical protein AMC99_01907 [Altererythrobacter epoxidivorans]
MKFRNLAAATAALSLAASPAVAEAALDRGAAPVEGASELGGDGNGSGIILAILAAAAIIAGIVIAAGSGGDDDPISA